MGKIGLVIDSTSSIDLKEATKRGIGYIPLVISIDGVDKKSGVDITIDELYKRMENRDVKISTSLPLGKDIEKAFDNALLKYEKVIYIGLSKKFSGAHNAIVNFIKQDKYEGRVFVYDTKWSAPWTGLHLDEIIDLTKTEKNVEDIFKKLDLPLPWMIGYMSPKDTYWFYKGGRITRVQYLASNFLKVLPILTVKDGEIDQKSVIKMRTVKKTMIKMCELMNDKVDKLKEMKIPFTLLSLKSENVENNKLMIETIIEFFKVEKKDIISLELSTEQTAHLGPGSFGLSLFVPIKGLVKK